MVKSVRQHMPIPISKNQTVRIRDLVGVVQISTNTRSSEDLSKVTWEMSNVGMYGDCVSIDDLAQLCVLESCISSL